MGSYHGIIEVKKDLQDHQVKLPRPFTKSCPLVPCPRDPKHHRELLWATTDPMGLYGFLWAPMGHYDPYMPLWTPTGLYGPLWAPRGHYELLWTTTHLRPPLDAYRSHRASTDLCGALWDPMGSYGLL